MRTTTRPSRSRDETVRAALSPVAPATATRTVSRPSHATGRLLPIRNASPNGRLFSNAYCPSAFEGREFTGLSRQ
jgi:hypothetical protein